MKEWQNYEEVVRRIYSRMGGEEGVTVKCSGPKCKVQGSNGVDHQVDVLTSHSLGIHEYLTAIECKHWNRKITKEAVIKAAYIRKEAGISKVVIVTTVGYTPDAVNVAKSEHVELLLLRTPTESDWEGRVRNIEISISITLPELTKREFITVNSMENKEWMQGNWCSLKYADGTVTPVRFLEDNFLEGMKHSTSESAHCETIEFDPPALLMSREECTQVSSLKLEGHYRTTAPKAVRIRGEDHVAYIMQTEFGTKRHVVDSDYRIHEKP